MPHFGGDMAKDSPTSTRFSARAWVPSISRATAAKLFLGAVGLVLLGVGAVKFAAAKGDSGTVSLVVAGAVLLITPFLLERIERVSVGATSVDLWLTTQVSEQGAPHAAEILQRTTLGTFAESYALVHAELTGQIYRPARIHLQDLLVNRAASIAQQERFQAQEVRTLFTNGSLVVRVLALGIMQGDISLADAATITAAITDGRSRNEQYQALQLAKRCWHRLSASDKRQIRASIDSEKLTGSRWPLAQEVLNLPYP